MLKRLAQTAIKACVKRVPWGIRNALLQGLSEREGHWYLLTQYAQEAGICAFMAEGDSGVIQASLTDATIFRAYARTKTWASTTVAFLRQAFPAGAGTYLDVGGNIGLTIIPIARDANVRCIAFEPDPTNFNHLAENVRRNCHNSNVELVNAAVMDKAGTVTFGLNAGGNPGDHRVIRGDTSRETISARAISLDEQFPDLGGPLAIKIDTQGAEPFVIAGGRKVFSLANAIVMEFWPFGMDQLKAPFDEIYGLVKQFRGIAISSGEKDDKRVFINADQAIAELTRLFEAAKHDSSMYWDIYLTR